jgi:predicted RNase H-like HicB family nuclease
MRRIATYPGEDGYWVAECPSLPGCLCQGKTSEDAILNMTDAIEGHIAALREDGLTVPGEDLEDG